MSDKLFPEFNFNKGQQTLIKGVGGSQVAGEAVLCEISLESGWSCKHQLKPIHFPEKPRTVLLGRDFMSQYGDTVFDWENGRVKLGEEWVMLTTVEEPVEKRYKINDTSITKDQQKTLRDILEEYSDVFAKNHRAPKECVGAKHYIQSKSDQVCYEKVRRIPAKWKDDIKTQVDEMVRNGIICKSKSPYNSNVILVKKKDNSNRFVIDYRNVNKSTVSDKYPIPNVDDLIEGCRGAKFFTQLDLASAYWCVPIAEKDRIKTAFTVPQGKYHCIRMPYGLKNSGPTFQRMADDMVREVEERGAEGVGAYMDNVYIVSVTFEEHCESLRIVLQSMRERNFSVRADKCEIAYPEIEMLGYKVNGTSLSPAPHNVKKLGEFPRPKNRKELQSLLGIANFNRRFIKDFAVIAKPLSTLTSCKVTFKWGNEEEEAFQTLKKCLSETSILGLPDWNLPFQMETDASEIATGALLFQIDKNKQKVSLSYHSRTLNPTQSKWSATERELFAIVDSIKKYSVYCNGKVIFHTDHEPLKNIRGQRDPRGKIGRWLITLDSVDCDLHYIAGKDNVVADSLSRIVTKDDLDYEDKAEEHIYAIDRKATIREGQEHDKAVIRAVKQLKKKGKVTKGFYRNHSNLGIKEGLLMKGNRIVVPTQQTEALIIDYHGQNHPGVESTTAIIRSRFWWRSMAKQIKQLVDNCRTCVQTKVRKTPKAEMQVMENPKPREAIAIDLGSLPNTPRGNVCFLVIVDLGTKMVSILPLPNQEAAVIKLALWKGYIGIYGVPKVLVSDQGPNVDGKVIRQICDELNMEKRHSSAYHPQGNGSAEKMVDIFKNKIRAMCASRGAKLTDWDLLAPEAQLAINSQTNKSLRYSPFKCTFGMEARTPVDSFYDIPTFDTYVEPAIVQEDADKNRDEAKMSYKREHDKDASNQVLEVGQRVLVKRTHGKFPKAAVKWVDGPFILTKKVGPVNWAVTDAAGKSKIKHHNLIRPALEKREPARTPELQDYYDLDYCANPSEGNRSLEEVVLEEQVVSDVEDDVSQNNEDIQRESERSTTAIDQAAFRRNVMAIPESRDVVLRSGRVSKKVIGNRLYVDEEN